MRGVGEYSSSVSCAELTRAVRGVPTDVVERLRRVSAAAKHATRAFGADSVDSGEMAPFGEYHSAKSPSDGTPSYRRVQ